MTTGGNQIDISTCGGIHSIGSDFTRTKGRCETYQNGSVRSQMAISKARENDIHIHTRSLWLRERALSLGLRKRRRSEEANSSKTWSQVSEDHCLKKFQERLIGRSNKGLFNIISK